MIAWLTVNMVLTIIVAAITITAAVRTDLRHRLAKTLVWTGCALAAPSISFLVVPVTTM